MQIDLVLYNKNTLEIVAIFSNGRLEARVIIQDDYRLIEIDNEIEYIDNSDGKTSRIREDLIKPLNNIVYLDDYRQRG